MPLKLKVDLTAGRPKHHRQHRANLAVSGTLTKDHKHVRGKVSRSLSCCIRRSLGALSVPALPI